jgi:hypothetical protein
LPHVRHERAAGGVELGRGQTILLERERGLNAKLSSQTPLILLTDGSDYTLGEGTAIVAATYKIVDLPT